MKVGTVYKFCNGKYTCRYLCIFSSHVLGWTLKRLQLPKTKADANRFPVEMSITIGPNTLPEKKKK